MQNKEKANLVEKIELKAKVNEGVASGSSSGSSGSNGSSGSSGNSASS